MESSSTTDAMQIESTEIDRTDPDWIATLLLADSRFRDFQSLLDDVPPVPVSNMESTDGDDQSQHDNSKHSLRESDEPASDKASRMLSESAKFEQSTVSN